MTAKKYAFSQHKDKLSLQSIGWNHVSQNKFTRRQDDKIRIINTVSPVNNWGKLEIHEFLVKP